MRKNKITALILTAALALSGIGLTGCDATGNAVKADPDSKLGQALACMKELETHGENVKQGEKLQYMIENNIETEDKEVTGNPDVLSASMVQISGLKDSEVQRKINRAIEDRFYEMYESSKLPPFRGVNIQMRKIDKNSASYTQGSRMYSYVGFNCNNIISVLMYKNYNFEDSDSYVYLNDVDALNFDLNTGELIGLQDIFADGFDYVSYINKIIEDYNLKLGDAEYPDYYTEDNYTIFSNFETIWPECKFTLDNYSGNLQLIFDYNTDFVASSNYYELFTIDPGENNAIGKRFMGEDSLFTDETVSKVLLYDQQSSLVSDYHYEEKEGDLSHMDMFDETYLSTNESISKDVPEEIVEKAEKILKDKHSMDKEIEDYYRTVVTNNGTFWPSSTSLDAWKSANNYFYGNYGVVNISQGFSVTGGYKDDSPTQYSTKSIVYDRNTGKELQLKDFFNTGEYKKLIVDAMLTSFNAYAEECRKYENYQPTYAVEAYEEGLRELAELLYEEIDSISPSRDSFSVNYKNKKAAVEKFMGDAAYEDQGDRLQLFIDSFGNSLSYKYIGCSNLKIFEN